MSFYLTLIAFNKGFRYGRLSPLAATRASHPGFGKIAVGHRGNLALPMETANPATSATSRWFDDYKTSNSLRTVEFTQSSYNFSTRRSAHLHRPTAQRTIPRGHFPSSSSSPAVIPTAEQPAYLRSRVRDTAEILAECLQGRVEQATRDSWARSGLRISPFRLQGFARLG